MGNTSSFGECTPPHIAWDRLRGQDERTCCRCCKGGSHSRACRSEEPGEESRSARTDEDLGHPLPWLLTWCQTPGQERSGPVAPAAASVRYAHESASPPAIPPHSPPFRERLARALTRASFCHGSVPGLLAQRGNGHGVAAVARREHTS